MSLYGYSRKTNPLLENIKNELLIFNNVISSDLQTSPSLKKALTFANSEFPGYYYQKPSIIEIFNALNFHTSWIDNQYYRLDDKSPDIYMKIAGLSKEFVNLMGSHLPYKIRYPDSFSKFTGVNGISSKVKDQLKMNQVEIINEYDNSVLYNDFVISSIINLVKGKGGLSYIIYFSDHGEEVFDEKVYSGRSFDNITPDMCQIPFILWLSDEYKKQRPLNINLERSYSIEDVIHTILDLSFINQADYDSTRSLVSDYFTERVRCVNGKNYSKIPQ
jgi:heptose-I-phosphate ethanolaminephosphotransferase